MKNSPELVAKWIKQTLEDGRGVTAWENDFLVSVGEQLERKGTISEKQEEIVERIYSERTE
jgi:hypothetical protein